MTTLSTYKYYVNAIYVVETLNEIGIIAEINEVKIDDQVLFEVKVSVNDIHKAKHALTQMDLDDTTIDQDAKGYIDGYIEWSNKMYDPGHYTGGKIPHYLKDKSNWKFFGFYFLMGGLLGVYFIVNNGFRDLDFIKLFWIGLYIFTGISLIWQLKRKKK